jgi:hypothetical protein
MRIRYGHHCDECHTLKQRSRFLGLWITAICPRIWDTLSERVLIRAVKAS